MGQDAGARKFEADLFIAVVAQDLDEVSQVFHRNTVDLAEHRAIGVVVAPGDAMGKKRRCYDDQLFVLEGRFVKAPCHQRARPAAHGRRPLVAHPFQIILRGLREHERPEDKKPRSLIHQIRNDQVPLVAHRQIDFGEPPVAIDRQRQEPVLGVFLHQIRGREAEVVAHRDFAVAVDRHIADLGDDVPFLQRIIRVVAVGLGDHDAIHVLGKSKALAQRFVFDRLNQIEDLRFAVVDAVGDIVQEKLDFFDGNQVADVLRVLNQTEHQSNQLSIRYRRAAAVAKVERGVDLDTQAGRLVVVIGVLDARDDPLGDGKLGAAGRITVHIDRVFDARQLLGERQAAAFVEKRFVVEFEDSQIHSRGDRFDPCRNLGRGLIRLHINLARILHHVRVGQNTLAVNDHAGAFHLLRAYSCPGAQQIRAVMDCMNLHDQIANVVLSVQPLRRDGAAQQDE